MYDTPKIPLRADDLTIGIAVSLYHEDITQAMCDGAVDAFEAAGGAADRLHVVSTPGAFELTVVSRALAARPEIHGVVALGCVIRGETAHDQHIAAAVAHGLTQITLETGKPVGFGLLTCHTKHQARERAGGGKGNKGAEAMHATLGTARVLLDLARGPAASGSGSPEGASR